MSTSATTLPPQITDDDLKDVMNNSTASAFDASGSIAFICPFRAQGKSPTEHPSFELSTPRQNSENVTRRRISGICDVVTVSGPREIIAFENDSAVGRPGDGKLPWWINVFMKISKFYCPQSDRWFVGFVGNGFSDWKVRMNYIVGRINNGGYSQDDVHDIARLLTQPGTEDEVSARATRMVARLFLPEELPHDIVEAARNTVLGIPVGPVDYIKSAHAQNKVYQYVKRFVHAEHVEDICHNLGAAAHGVAAGLELIRNEQSTVKDISTLLDELFRSPLIPRAIRLATGESTVGGLLEEPLVKNKTVIMLEFGKAATISKDEKFLFGPGTVDRQCPFKNFFLRVFSRNIKVRGKPDLLLPVPQP